VAGTTGRVVGSRITDDKQESAAEVDAARDSGAVDEFGLRIEDGDDATGGFWPKAVVIYINGARLYDLSRAAASAPDEEWIAPPPGIVLPPSRQLLEGRTSGRTLTSRGSRADESRLVRVAVLTRAATPSWLRSTSTAMW
jgi:hypothetical protein